MSNSTEKPPETPEEIRKQILDGEAAQRGQIKEIFENEAAVTSPGPQISIGQNQGNVVLQFGTPVQYVQMPPGFALKLGRMLMAEAKRTWKKHRRFANRNGRRKGK